MELRLKRWKGPKYSIGKLYINGEYFCDTLEDVDRGLDDSMSVEEIKAKKVYGETAIPTGKYTVDMHTISPKYSNFSRYKWAKKWGGMLPRLLNVKGFEGILMHVGNHPSNSYGCVLVGENKVKGSVINSTATFDKLMFLLRDASDQDEQITITIE